MRQAACGLRCRPLRLTAEEAIEWARARAAAVAVRYKGVWYTAGEKSLPGYEPWPANLGGEE